MNTVLHKNIVLVLNRNWQAINVTTPAMAFCQMAGDVATGLDILGVDSMIPIEWEHWMELPVRENDNAVGTSRGDMAPGLGNRENEERTPMGNRAQK